ncbi:hypothetical protein MKZ38_008858 [Zalerion maritima]|uniref:Enoyl reductase (ER) domain-containing protein n=1 Tax=Zalerion maritima TaxID=339359 RepID=A0AAD5WNE5_9PEZI|nr:hypothetical protein MKZ38_008858 [Zalerion maritima]
MLIVPYIHSLTPSSLVIQHDFYEFLQSNRRLIDKVSSRMSATNGSTGTAAVSVPTTQKAVVIKQTGKSWSIAVDSSFPVPVPKEGEALVRLSCTGVCHSDLSGFNGGWVRQATCSVPGHEGIGRIISYHPSTNTASPLADGTVLPPVGSKIGVPLIRKPCEKCNICLLPDGEVMCPHTGFHGMQVDGTFQQYMTVATSYMVPIPEGVDEVLAAPVLCGGVTSYKAIKKSGARKGEWLVVAGAGGGLGIFAVQYGVALGLRVIGIDTGKEKKGAVLGLGAEGFVDYMEETGDLLPKKILDMTDGGAHAVLVIAPSENTYNQSLEYARVQGTIVCVGLPHEDVRLRVPPGLVLHHDLTIKGSMVGTRRDIREAMEFVEKGLVKPTVLVHEMGEVEEVFRKMERNEVLGRAVLKLEFPYFQEGTKEQAQEQSAFHYCGLMTGTLGKEEQPAQLSVKVQVGPSLPLASQDLQLPIHQQRPKNAALKQLRRNRVINYSTQLIVSKSTPQKLGVVQTPFLISILYIRQSH